MNKKTSGGEGIRRLVHPPARPNEPSCRENGVESEQSLQRETEIGGCDAWRERETDPGRRGLAIGGGGGQGAEAGATYRKREVEDEDEEAVHAAAATGVDAIRSGGRRRAEDPSHNQNGPSPASPLACPAPAIPSSGATTSEPSRTVLQVVESECECARDRGERLG